VPWDGNNVPASFRMRMKSGRGTGGNPADFVPERKGDGVMKAARKLDVAVKPIPDGYHSITPHLTVRGARRAIDFYRRAFGAEELGRMQGPDGKTVMHAELKIGDSRFFLGDEVPGMDCRSPETLGGSPSGIYLYVRNVDEAFQTAVDAGATVKRPVEDMFWGDRTGSILDPFGYVWDLATHREDVPPEEMKRRGEEFFRKMKGGKS
jgi:PhnB protein